MKLRIYRLLLAYLIVVVIVLNACSVEQNQSIILEPSPSLATSTPVPATLTLTATITASSTSLLSAMLTTSPTIAYTLPALPPDCGTVKLGRAGTQTIDNSQKVIVQGTAIICGQMYLDETGFFSHPAVVVEAMLDLDTGTFDLDSADLFFCPSGGSDTFYYYCEVNNSKVREYGVALEVVKEPTFEDCSSVINPHEATNDSEPVYVCVITNRGNVSRIKLEKRDPIGGAGAAEEISFVTWEK